MKTSHGNSKSGGYGSSPAKKQRTPRHSDAEDLKHMFEQDLKDIHWAENHLIKVLPKMIKAAESQELVQAFQDHLDKTQSHITRLEKVFELSGLKVGSKKCEGMEGLTTEGGEVIDEYDKGVVRDAGLIIAAQKVEHYEIAAYGSLRAMAGVMGLDEAATILQETLDEEGESNEHLTTLADRINEEAYTVTNEAEVVVPQL